MKLGNDGALTGRLIAIVILTAVSGGSFTLGYFVGRTSTPAEVRGDVVQAYEAPADTVEEAAATNESREVVEEPSMLKPTLDVAPKEPQAETKELRVKKRALKTQAQGAYSVQAGVFKEKEYAESFVMKLKKRGYGAYMHSSGAVFVVKVGKFESKAEAEALVLRLKESEGIEGFVTGPG